MKVLILTYYWPPAGGSGVQRWLKFVKYLRQFDIEPVIYTANTDYVLRDDSLLKEVPFGVKILKTNVTEPNRFFNFFGKKKKKISAGFLNPSPGFLGRFFQYIRANYFIPDARKFWIQPSVKFLSDYLKENSVDLIISTGPPHSMHLIAQKLKEQLSVKWISDFRDSWTEIDYFHQLPLSKKSLQKHKKLESRVLEYSDYIVVVGKQMKSKFEMINPNVLVISNGYDDESDSIKVNLDEKFSITHIGLMNSDRNPHIFWEAIYELIDEISGFKNDVLVKIIGSVADDVREDSQIISSNLELVNYLPHSEVRNLQKSSQVLLLSINKVPSARGIVTGKIFEYLKSNRPIVGIGPTDGDAAFILNETSSGKMFDYNEKGSLKKHILSLYKQYKKGTLVSKPKNIENYHRKELTRQLSELIHKIL